MLRPALAVVAVAAFPVTAGAAPVPGPAPPDTFLVQDPGAAFLDSSGKEKERIDPYTSGGSLSPDGRWLAGVVFETNPNRMKVVVRPRGRAGDPLTVPMFWDVPGHSGCLLVWSADGKQVLIGETHTTKAGVTETANRIYDLETRKLTELDLPAGHEVSGWFRDRKRVVTTAYGSDTLRVAVVAADGTGRPDFLTPADEMASYARLSPDGRRVLFTAGPKLVGGQRTRTRLYAMDLATRTRTAVDDPGETHGYCWSSDGSKIAYTWQRALDGSADVPVRETVLFTCDADGRHRKAVTTRTREVHPDSNGRSGIVIFFRVSDWR